MVLGRSIGSAQMPMKCGGEKGCLTNSNGKTNRRQQCPTLVKVLELARPRDAQSVTASLASSGTIRGEPRFAPRSASIASELAVKTTAIG
jgi:hypothetical protein